MRKSTIVKTILAVSLAVYTPATWSGFLIFLGFMTLVEIYGYYIQEETEEGL